MKKLESDKNESFNIIKSREKESIARKVKKTNNVHGKPLRRDEKPRVSKGKCPLLFQALWERWKFFLYNDGVLPKRKAFSLPHFHTNFLLFSLMFSLGSYHNGLATYSSYSLRNVARYKRRVLNHDSSI